jgi:hypothetical protein
MQKIFSSLFVAAIALVAASCGGGDTPSAITESIYSQLQKGNYEKAFAIWADNLDEEELPAAEEKAAFVSALSEKAKQSAEVNGGAISFKIENEEIAEDGNSATVKLTIVYGERGGIGTERNRYVKKDGKWKLLLGRISR